MSSSTVAAASRYAHAHKEINDRSSSRSTNTSTASSSRRTAMSSTPPTTAESGSGAADAENDWGDIKEERVGGHARTRSTSLKKEGLLERRARKRTSTETGTGTATGTGTNTGGKGPATLSPASDDRVPRMRVETIRQRVDPGEVLESEERQMGDRRVQGEVSTGREGVDDAMRDARRLARMAQAMGIVFPTLPSAPTAGYHRMHEVGSQSASPARTAFSIRAHATLAHANSQAGHLSPSSAGPSRSPYAPIRPTLGSQSSSKSLLSPLGSPMEPSPSSTSLPIRRAGSALSNRSANSARSAGSRPSSVGGGRRHLVNVRPNVSSQQARFLIKVVPPDHMFIPPPTTEGDASVGAAIGFHGLISPPPSTEIGPSPSSSTESINARTAQTAMFAAQAKQLARWRGGKILPLRPNLDGMIKQVVEEWGLPSALGVVVYLTSLTADDRAAVQGGGTGSDEGEGDDADVVHDNELIGSEIGKEAWSILWSPAFAAAKREARLATLIANGEHKGMRLLRSRRISNGGVLPSRSVESMRPAVGAELEILQTPSKDGSGHSGLVTPAATQLSFHSQFSGVSPGSSSIAPSASASQTDSPSRSSPLGSTARGVKGRLPQSVLGTIEFDVDLSKAGSGWYTAWMKRRRETARVKLARTTRSPGGESNARPMLKELALRPGGPGFDSSSYEVLMNEESDRDRHATGILDGTGFGSDDEDLMSLMNSRKLRLDSTHTEREIDIKDIGTHRVLSGDISLEQAGLRPAASRQASVSQDIAEIAAMLGVPPGDLESHLREGAGGGLAVSPTYLQNGLASPIDLPSPHRAKSFIPNGPPLHTMAGASLGSLHPDLGSRPGGPPEMVGLGVGLTSEYVGEADRWQGSTRESTVIMRDKLDDLEKVLKALSPRHLRFSTLPSPGYSLLQSKGHFDGGPQGDMPAERPLRTTSRQAGSSLGDAVMSSRIPRPAANTSMGSAAPEPKSAQSAPAWPAIPFIKTPENSPLLPQEVTLLRQYDGQKLTPRSAPEGTIPIPLSPETMMRMEYETSGFPDGSNASNRPLRPARPPTPMLDVYVAPSPPLKLHGDAHTSDDLESNQSILPAATQQLEQLSQPEVDYVRRADGPSLVKAMKKQKSVGRLNQLFQRKVSEVGSSAGPLKIAPGPPLPMIRAISASGTPTSPIPTSPSMEDFGAFPPSMDSKNATFPPKSPRSGGFGRRLLSGLHSRGLSSSDKKEMEEVMIAQRKALGMMSPERPPVPALPKRHAAPAAPGPQAVLHRVTTESAPSRPSIDQTFSSPESPSKSRQPTSPTTATSPSSVRRKPVPRNSKDALLPTSTSSGSLSFGGMGGMGHSASGHDVHSLVAGNIRSGGL